MRKFLTIHGPWVAMMLLITIESSIPDVPVPDLGVDYSDKIYHFVIFGMLGLFLIRGMFLAVNHLLRKNPFAATFLIGTLFGLSDEIHQSFVPGRNMDLYDWAADILGIVLFALVYRIYLNKKNTSTAPGAEEKSL